MTGLTDTGSTVVATVLDTPQSSGIRLPSLGIALGKLDMTAIVDTPISILAPELVTCTGTNVTPSVLEIPHHTGIRLLSRMTLEL